MTFSHSVHSNADEEANEEERKRASSPTYVEEQEALKNTFKKLLNDDEQDPDEDGIAGFLKVKVKSANEKVMLKSAEKNYCFLL